MLAMLKTAGRFAAKHWPLTVIFVAAIVVAVNPQILERRFVYYPTREIAEDPSAVGLPFQDVFLTTEDGIRLHGWFVPCEGAQTTLLIFHGNAGNIGHRVGWIEMLHRLRVDVWIIDYRGYGRSAGKPFEEGLYRDARAAYRWWTSRNSAAEQKLVLLGESLGGAVAVDLASRVSVAGIILQSTFSSASDMAKTIFPLGLLQPIIGIHFDSASKIRNVACPKLFLHGNRDEIVPFRLGQKLFDLAPGPKQFCEVPGAGHNDLVWVAGGEYTEKIAGFLATLH